MAIFNNTEPSFHFEGFVSKTILRNFNHFQGFRQSYLMPGTFRSVPSIDFRGPWAIVLTEPNKVSLSGEGY